MLSVLSMDSRLRGNSVGVRFCYSTRTGLKPRAANSGSSRIASLRKFIPGTCGYK